MSNQPPTASAGEGNYMQKLEVIHVEALREAYQLGRADEAKKHTKVLQAAEVQAKLEAAQHIRKICPVTEGVPVERLHHRIESYVHELQSMLGEQE